MAGLDPAISIQKLSEQVASGWLEQVRP